MAKNCLLAGGCTDMVVMNIVPADQVWREGRQILPGCRPHATSYLLADTAKAAKVIEEPGHEGSLAVILRETDRLDELPFPWPPEGRS